MVSAPVFRKNRASGLCPSRVDLKLDSHPGQHVGAALLAPNQYPNARPDPNLRPAALLWDCKSGAPGSTSVGHCLRCRRLEPIGWTFHSSRQVKGPEAVVACHFCPSAPQHSPYCQSARMHLEYLYRCNQRLHCRSDQYHLRDHCECMYIRRLIMLGRTARRGIAALPPNGFKTRSQTKNTRSP
jgi:hypothetical protein